MMIPHSLHRGILYPLWYISISLGFKNDLSGPLYWWTMDTLLERVMFSAIAKWTIQSPGKLSKSGKPSWSYFCWNSQCGHNSHLWKDQGKSFHHVTGQLQFCLQREERRKSLVRNPELASCGVNPGIQEVFISQILIKVPFFMEEHSWLLKLLSFKLLKNDFLHLVTLWSSLGLKHCLSSSSAI